MAITSDSSLAKCFIQNKFAVYSLQVTIFNIIAVCSFKSRFLILLQCIAYRSQFLTLLQFIIYMSQFFILKLVFFLYHRIATIKQKKKYFSKNVANILNTIRIQFFISLNFKFINCTKKIKMFQVLTCCAVCVNLRVLHPI